MKKTQKEMIRSYLKTGKSITPLEALRKFGCFRLGARIWELKKDGLRIRTKFVHKNNKTFAEYRLLK